MNPVERRIRESHESDDSTFIWDIRDGDSCWEWRARAYRNDHNRRLFNQTAAWGLSLSAFILILTYRAGGRDADGD